MLPVLYGLFISIVDMKRKNIMRKILVVLTALFCITVYADVTNYRAQGRFESKNPIGCKNISGLSNKNTPPDIFIGIRKCLDKDNYQDASQLYFVALAYGRYDINRVEDTTAHQAVYVLRSNHFFNVSKEKMEKLQLSMKQTFNSNDSVCVALKQLGKPDYYPSYMIRHGMNAIIKREAKEMGAIVENTSKDGIIANFNPNRSWEDVLNGYVKCPP